MTSQAPVHSRAADLLGLAALGVAIGFFAMVGTLGYQAYLYLRYGEWVPISITDACGSYLHVAWCNAPETWLGVHRILSALNAGAAFFLASMLVLWIAVLSED